ncbi:MAG: fasciclin domain-containing protein [Prevotella sp.]|nr:fasciclin domain-containing protein [Prevotella sp.]
MNHKIMALCLLLCCTLQACIDDAVQNFRTAEEDGITAYLEKDPERYSEFLKLMRETGIDALLDARGNYTCFIPVNEAVLQYYDEKSIAFDQLTQEEIKEIVYNHIIRQDNPADLPLTTNLFPNGTVGLPNMLGKFLQTTYDSLGNIIVNQSAKILIPDQDKESYKIYNGVIHTIDKVLEVSKGRLPGLIEERPEYSLFAEALKETGLVDSLEYYRDEDYERRRNIMVPAEIPEEILSLSTFNHKGNYQNKGGNLSTPATRLIGFTVLMESDAVYNAAGIFTLADLKQYAEDHVVPQGTSNDPKNRYNSLNRFIAYHILDKTMDVNDFIPSDWTKKYYMKNAEAVGALVDYSTTLDPYGIVEIRRDALSPLLNRRSDGSAVRILKENDNVSENGMFHGLDRILVYDDGVESDVLNKRLRMDATVMLPEMYTNRLKGNAPYGKGLIFPKGYLKNMIQLTDETQIQYGGAIDWGPDLHLDEILCAGKYDIMLRLPPVPEGTYEIRLGYTANTKRGVLQIYLDGIPLGIPLDMTKPASDLSVGYETPGSNPSDPDGYENDKAMRNHGYMKGPSTIASSSSGSSSLRESSGARRKILTTAQLKRGEHWLRFKSVEELDTREFMFDYFELVPSTAYPNHDEDIY